MKRTLLPALACSALLYAQAPPAMTTSTWHFVTPQSRESLEDAVGILRTVANMPQVSMDISTATLNFSGPAESVAFVQWLLPVIDTTSPDSIAHEFKFASGDIGRVIFVPNAQTPQQMQELITVLRTVPDVQRIRTFSANHAIVLRAPEWQSLFAQWILDGLAQPVPAGAHAPVREFTVGGPDYRGLGHAARINMLAYSNSPRQTQEILTILRTVDQVQKVFSYTATHALVFRAGDTDLARAEWLIAQLDSPSPSSTPTFIDPAADDVTRVFHIGNATPQWLQSTVTGIRIDLGIPKVFSMLSPAAIAVRGTSDQIAAAATYLTAHNALLR
jgi:hypothetical protein